MDILLGTVTIEAVDKWSRTGIRLEWGRRYRMSATGKWCDRGLPYGPAGGPAQSVFQSIFAWARRRPHEPWFVLVGAIDRQEATAFTIGADLPSFSPPVSGELTCYANDVGLAYGNNSGSVRLTVWQL